ncbi:hypothetical protein AB0C04_24230 [Micromonospora sp. NPDC048909]|uniref:hypothetical protein n=1 Tax=Micromonospora sp. NPDC048909 TaxID=3155643 RepID=UPI0033E677F0
MEPPTSFSYRIDNFSLPRLREVVDSIEGPWYFDQEDGATSMEWTYALNTMDEPGRAVIKEDLLPLYTERLKTATNSLEGRPRVLTTAPRTGSTPGGAAGPAPGVW